MAMVARLPMPELLVEHAKETLGQFPCGWGSCNRGLNCWNILQQHLERHSKKACDQEGRWMCKISNCAGRFHSSLSTLQEHIDLSHMSRVLVPCPIQGCTHEQIRLAHLEMHIAAYHPDLPANFIDNSKMFKPQHAPSTPSTPPPPPLPSGLLLLSEIDPLPARGSPRKCSRPRSPSQFGRKWSRMTAQDDENTDPITIDLEDLPLFPHSRHDVLAFSSRRKPPEVADWGLSVPCRMMDPPPPDEEPPVSIHFDTFAQKVDEIAKGAKS